MAAALLGTRYKIVKKNALLMPKRMIDMTKMLHKTKGANLVVGKNVPTSCTAQKRKPVTLLTSYAEWNMKQNMKCKFLKRLVSFYISL